MIGSAAHAADIDAAAALYEGRSESASGSAAIGDARHPASRFACRGCHGRDGRGGGESGAPAIDGPALFAPSPDRPAYDDSTFAAAISQGVAPSGRVFSTVMPRYALSSDVVAGLAAYLRELPARQRRGITVDGITFAVPAPAGFENSAKAYADLLQGHVQQALGSSRIYGRTVRVTTLAGTPSEIVSKAEATAFAVVALPPSATSTIRNYAERGVPVLFPLSPLSGEEDATLVRSFAPSWRDIAKALVDELDRRQINALNVISMSERPMAEALRKTAWKGKITFLNPNDKQDGCRPPECAALVLPAGQPAQLDLALQVLPLEVPVYIPATEGAWVDMKGADRDRDVTILVETPALLSLAMSRQAPIMEAHSAIAAAVLVEALRASGPDPTRAALLTVFRDLALPDFDLDYRKTRLTGTSTILLRRTGAIR